MFQNKIEIPDKVEIITNPESLVIIDSQICQYGNKYYTYKTIRNYIIHAILKMVRFFKW